MTADPPACHLLPSARPARNAGSPPNDRSPRRPGLTRSTRPARSPARGAGLVAVVCLLVLGAASGPAGARPGAGTSSARGLTVSSADGTGTVAGVGVAEVAEVAAGVDEGAAPGQATQIAAGRSSTDEDRKVWAVVGGLVAVALGLTALTIRYWRVTRPRPRADRRAGANASDLGPTPEVSDLDAFIDQAVASPQPPDTDGPIVRPEPEPAPGTGPADPVDLGADVGADTETVAGIPVDVEPGDTPPGPVEPVDRDRGALEGQVSTDAVPGSAGVGAVEADHAGADHAGADHAGADHAEADHAGADTGWEARATGELPAVDTSSVRRTVRPSRGERAAALGLVDRP